ncbi:RHS repeat-associated core domain-containing protein [Rheinheimera sp.]|uniref:RHS repeat-associated core domain-containing protein n=1 Tax=Rheinheimera sp. TaxID=1869214 RepID=UPI00307DDAE8
MAEYNSSGTLLRRYVHGAGSDDPLVWFEGSGTGSPSYLLTDERGSVIAETNASGTVTTPHQYGPYGEPINSSASRFRYTGQILLPGTELYHYKARVYHPKLGRFLQTDPLGYKDGINWYAYVGNDPMNMVDASGLCGTRIKGESAVGCETINFKTVLTESPVGQAWQGAVDAMRNAEQSAVDTAVDTVGAPLEDGQAVKVEGCAAFYLGACGAISVTNDSVIMSGGFGRGYGASVGGAFVPMNADKIDGSVSWSTSMSYFIGSGGFELDYSKGSKPQIDVSIGPVGGFSINHTLMHHSVYKASGQ